MSLQGVHIRSLTSNYNSTGMIITKTGTEVSGFVKTGVYGTPCKSKNTLLQKYILEFYSEINKQNDIMFYAMILCCKATLGEEQPVHGRFRYMVDVLLLFLLFPYM